MVNSMDASQKAKKIEFPNNPKILLLGRYPDKASIQKETGTPILIAALFTIIAKTWKQPNCPSIDEWIKRCNNIHNGILLGH